MEQNHPDQAVNIAQASEAFGKVRNDAERFGTLPNGSETFGKVPHDSESFRNVPKGSERKENHTLTVRETARLFEAAGVARTERSIVNWCQLNAQGVARLDAYYDPNERKYYISPQSVERAIQEEIARVAKANAPSEPVGTVPKGSERPEHPGPEISPGRTRDLENEVMDLKITNKAKDYFIERLEKERGHLMEQVVEASRKVGELETRLLQLEGPKQNTQGIQH